MTTPAPAESARPPVSPEKRTTHLLVFFTILIDLIGFGILIPNLQPLLRHLLGAQDQLNSHEGFLVGAIMGIYSLMQFIFAPIMGRWSDRIGRRPVIISSLVGSMLGYLVIAFACHSSCSGYLGVALLFFARIMTGICGASYATAQACLTDITAPEKRVAVMGMIGAAFGLGFMIGPVLGGIATKLGVAAPFLIAAVMSLCNALWCWKKLPETLPIEKRGQTHDRKSLAATLKHLTGTGFPTIALANFLLIAAFSMMTTSFVPWAGDALGLKSPISGHGDDRVGYIFLYIGFIGVLIQGGLIRKIAPGREKKLALIGIGLLVTSLAWLPFTSLWAVLLLCTTVMATGNSLATPTINSLGSRCADTTTQGEALGALSGIGSLGRACGPMLAGVILWLVPNHQHYQATFLAAAGIMAIAGMVVTKIAQPAALKKAS